MTALIIGPQNQWYRLNPNADHLWLCMSQHVTCLREFTLATIVEIEYLLHHGNLCISEEAPWQILENLRLGLSMLGIGDIESALCQARNKLTQSDPNTRMIRLEKHLV